MKLLLNVIWYTIVGNRLILVVMLYKAFIASIWLD